MADAKFTPGPWSVHAYDTSFWIKSADGIKVVQTSWHDAIRKPYPLKPEARANASLIAAAPELYEALDEADQLICARLSGHEDEAARIVVLGIRAALAKARGDQ